MRLVGCSPWDLLDHEQEERERDRAEAIRVAYVAATRARDLLVIPGVGDQPYEGWLSPLNRAIYPGLAHRRDAKQAPRCPAFGNDTLVERPIGYEEPPRSSVRPGLHRPELGSHNVVWWDPACLPKPKTANFGIRQEEILIRDAGGKAASESIRRYMEWKQDRASVLDNGSRPQFDLFAVTDAPELPEGFEARISFESVPRRGVRPQGARFGTLVHAILRDVDLGGAPEQIARLADIHARVFGCTAQEVTAAIDAATSALEHPLISAARRAAFCYRELPVLAKTDGGRMIEGNLDLAFVEGETWNVVDFKTDADASLLKAEYTRQLQ